ncbi:MAG: hypothetical protein WAT58_13225 [Candidatus Dormiibacterota bacterium]
MSRAIGLLLAAALMAACGSSGLNLQVTSTPCITAGQLVTITIMTSPGAELDWQVQDDFGGELNPKISPVTTDSGGKATVTWQSPSQLSTTTLHFLLTAKKDTARASRDIHVAVGGNGRAC